MQRRSFLKMLGVGAALPSAPLPERKYFEPALGKCVTPTEVAFSETMTFPFETEHIQFGKVITVESREHLDGLCREYGLRHNELPVVHEQPAADWDYPGPEHPRRRSTDSKWTYWEEKGFAGEVRGGELIRASV